MSVYIRYPANGGGSGTVTSVALVMPGIFSVAGSPVTGDGTLTVTLATETANKVWAGPTSGGAATPTFRSLVAADIPALPYSPSALTDSHIFVGNASNLAADVAMSGDITISNAGVTAIGAGKVTNTMLAGSIAFSKLAALNSANILVGNVSNVAASVAMSGDVTIDNAGVTAIGAGKVTNTMLAGSIAFSKLATLTSANILVGNVSNVAAAVAMSGDVAIDNAGATTIQAGAITNSKVNASAAIDFSKLATLSSANILVGSAGNVATSVAMSGDITITNAGVTAIGSGKVTNAMLAGSIAYSKLVLTGAILNADLAGSIAYSKLSLTGSIVNADIASAAAIVRTKLANSVVNAKSGTYTITSSDDIVTGDTTSAGFTLTLPAASSNSGKIYYIKKIDSSTNVLTVSRAGSDLIDGATTTTLTIQYESIVLISDGGTNWLVF